ncbi:hypothetical protein SUT503_03590 [Streptococcus parasuis]|nr:hypothetical protein SUT503_03590 [Streptococcus parasuis]
MIGYSNVTRNMTNDTPYKKRPGFPSLRILKANLTTVLFLLDEDNLQPKQSLTVLAFQFLGSG